MISGMNFDKMRFCAALLLLFAAIECGAQNVFHWHDEAGNSHFSDTPPSTQQPVSELALSLPAPLYVVEKVIDGDTIVVKNGGKVRLLGINTPEVSHRDRRGEAYGNEARARLQQLLEGQRVTLTFDKQRRDRFKRLLAYVVREDGTPVNELLLREGLARALFLQPNMQQLGHYFAIEAEAQRAERGIWSLREYRVRPASQATKCIKSFCRLHGRVKGVESKRDYTYLNLAAGLRVAIHHDQLPMFLDAGVNVTKLKGREVTLRGWIGSRDHTPYLRLQHPKQIEITPP